MTLSDKMECTCDSVWEQRRYEIAKFVIARVADGPAVEMADKAVVCADAVIALLKGDS